MNSSSKGSVLMLSSFTSGKLLFPLKSGQGKEKELSCVTINSCGSGSIYSSSCRVTISFSM